MPINLINEKNLNTYLSDIVYHGEEMETFNAGNFQNTDYVREHKDAIVRSMMMQWFKHRMRSYFMDAENSNFMTSVAYRDNLPDWAKNNLQDGKKIYNFDASKVSQKLTDEIGQVRDFMYSAAESYVDKTLAKAEETEKAPKLRIDYLKTSNEWNSFEKALIQAKKWHEVMANKAEHKKHNVGLYQKSIQGTKSIMKMAHGMEIVQLTTAEALDYESEYMGHCVGKGTYDNGVANGTIQIYSLRDEDGEPHATFEVRGNQVKQCKGKGNKTPVRKYIPYVQEFVEKKGFEIKGDMKNVGLIIQDGKYYSIYDLPEEGVDIKGDLDLSYMDLDGIQLNRLRVMEDLDLSSAEHLPKILDLSGIKTASLTDCSFLGVECFIPPRKEVRMTGAVDLPENLDLSGVEVAGLGYTKLADVKTFILPSKEIYLGGARSLPKKMDLSNLNIAVLSDCDLADVKLTLSCEEVDLSGAKLPKVLDLSSVKRAVLHGCNFRGVGTFISPVKDVYFGGVQNLPKMLDLSGTKKADLLGCDWSGVEKVILPPSNISSEWIGVKDIPKEIIQYANKKKNAEIVLSASLSKER